MTVNKIPDTEGKSVGCVWFDEKDEQQGSYFQPDTLEPTNTDG